MSPTQKRETVQRVRNEFEVSERRACRVFGFRRSSLRYRQRARVGEEVLRKRILELVRARPRFGHRQIARLLREEGNQVSNKRINRLWRQEGLKVPKKKRKSDPWATAVMHVIDIVRNMQIMFEAGTLSTIEPKAAKR